MCGSSCAICANFMGKTMQNEKKAGVKGFADLVVGSPEAKTFWLDATCVKMEDSGLGVHDPYAKEFALQVGLDWELAKDVYLQRKVKTDAIELAVSRTLSRSGGGAEGKVGWDGWVAWTARLAAVATTALVLGYSVGYFGWLSWFYGE